MTLSPSLQTVTASTLDVSRDATGGESGGDLLVRLQEYDETSSADGKVKKIKRPEEKSRVIENFIDGHKIDYVKGRIAFDLEWNSKDQTFDRDLYALRTFHDCGLVSVGVMVTRSASLNPVFDQVPKRTKSGDVKLHSTGPKRGKLKPSKASTARAQPGWVSYSTA